MIEVGPLVVSLLSASGEAGGGPRALSHAVDTAQVWLAALRSSDDGQLATWTALPFTHRSDGLQNKCDAIAADKGALQRWARCLRASKELQLTKLAEWQNVRIFRGLPPAGLTNLKTDIDDDDGYWVQGGFITPEGLGIEMAFLVVETPRSTAVRAFVIDAHWHPGHGPRSGEK